MTDAPLPPPRPTTPQEQQVRQQRQSLESYYNYLLQSGVKPNVAGAIMARKQPEEWEPQINQNAMPMGEPDEAPAGQVAPDAGAKNLWQDHQLMQGVPPSHMQTQVNYTAGDKSMQAKALQALTGNPAQAPAETKPGELLKPDSGYSPKFIEDYNQFQSQYQQRREENPAYWDYGLKWWGDVRRMIDQQRDKADDGRRGGAIDLMRPKPDFRE